MGTTKFFLLKILCWLFCFALIATTYAGRYDHMWTRQSRTEPTESHTVTLFVKLAEDALATCTTFIKDVSHPLSENYGKLWEFEDMKRFANKKAYHTTKKWLLTRFHKRQLEFAPNMEFISVKADVAQIEQVFGVELFEFQHGQRKDVMIRRPSTDYELPEELVEHVDVIDGLTGLPYYQAGQVPLITGSPIALNDTKRQGGQVVPQLLWSYYGVHNRKVESPSATQNIFASLGQSFSPADLVTWQQKFNLPASVVDKTIGPNDPSACKSNPNNCVENNLDVQQITSTAQQGHTSDWSIPATVNDIFLYWSQQMAKDPSPPLVNSISYGSLGPEDPKNDQRRFNVELCKLGLRGVTVMAASGDDGVANFQARNNPGKCGFTPSYPATAPFITAVGATQGPEMQQPEVMCSSSTGGGITSGGGFSDFFEMPDYQTAAYTAYLQNPSANLPPKNLFNSKGRAYPDVAMLGHNYPIVVGGNTYVGSGTSASSPVFASMVTLLNSLRIGKGKSPLGFLNHAIYHIASDPTLYKQVFNDITSGRNNCCAGAQGSATCCQYGFTAVAGADPTTGVGSIKFPGAEAYFVDTLP